MKHKLRGTRKWSNDDLPLIDMTLCERKRNTPSKMFRAVVASPGRRHRGRVKGFLLSHELRRSRREKLPRTQCMCPCMRNLCNFQLTRKTTTIANKPTHSVHVYAFRPRTPRIDKMGQVPQKKRASIKSSCSGVVVPGSSPKECMSESEVA